MRRDPYDLDVAPDPPTVEGLPTTGALGTEPAVTVAKVMGAAGLVVGIAAQVFGWQLPGDVAAFGDEWGKVLAGAVIAGWSLVQGRVTRDRVVAPATVAARYVRKPGAHATV